MYTDNLGIKVEKPRYKKLESGGASVSDVDHETDDDDDAKFYVEKSLMRVPSSWVGGMTEDAAALGVGPLLTSAGEFELAMDLHNNYQRRKRTLMVMVEDE